MNCSEFNSFVVELLRESSVDTELRSAALMHAEQCKECGIRLKGETSLTSALKDLAASSNRIEASTAFESRLLTSFREFHELHGVPQVRHHPRYLYPALAASVLLLIAATVYFLVSRNEGRPDIAVESQQINKDIPPDGSSSPVPKDTQATQGLDTMNKSGQMPISDSSRPSKPRNRIHRRSPEMLPDTTQVATDFIPLMYCPELSKDDGIQIVRIKVPRSTMLDYGLSVNDQLLDKPIDADVILGMDGMARAIRFVR